MAEGSKPGTVNVSAIDKALQAAKARKAAREGTTAATTATASTGTSKPRRTDEERAAQKLAKENERAQRKAERTADRDAKRSARDANKKPAHLAKVARAAEKLPAISQQAQLLMNEAVGKLSGADLAGLALHIQHHNRAEATKRALTQKLGVGMLVTINSGRFAGQTGTVTKAQRIRCYVEVPGTKKPVYLYTSDVEPTSALIAASG